MCGQHRNILSSPVRRIIEDGIYVIITIETFNEDELDMKMEQASDICEAAGAVDVLEADERIWSMRRNCLESCEPYQQGVHNG